MNHICCLRSRGIFSKNLSLFTDDYSAINAMILFLFIACRKYLQVNYQLFQVFNKLN